MTAKNKLAPGRVRCRCCQKSMAKAKRPSINRLTGRVLHVHYNCLADHVASRGSRCANKRAH